METIITIKLNVLTVALLLLFPIKFKFNYSSEQTNSVKLMDSSQFTCAKH